MLDTVEQHHRQPIAELRSQGGFAGVGSHIDVADLQYEAEFVGQLGQLCRRGQTHRASLAGEQLHLSVHPASIAVGCPNVVNVSGSGEGDVGSSADSPAQQLAGEASAEVAADGLLEPEPTSSPAPPPDLTAAAFFDVDNTLVHGSSLVHFARGLAAREYFTYKDLARFALAQAKFQLTGRENSQDVAAGRTKALAFIEGRSTAELVALGEEIYDEIIADTIWPGTQVLAQMHLDAGQQVWLVTATPYELAATIARRLGLTGALGTVAESVDGVFTGRLVGDILHGSGKAHAVRSLAIREGLNLRRCTAYSDSFNDVPMLSLVGTPVAINPDADLRDLARQRGWEIRDFRTARKAARIGVPSALALGAAGGALAAAVSRREKR